MIILGISAYYHDSAACLLTDGVILAAAQEERFTRIKHDSSFPVNALKYCLDVGGIGINQVDHIVFYDKPFLKFERLIETYVAFAPHGFKSFVKAMPIWLKEKLFQKKLLKDEFIEIGAEPSIEKKLLFAEHHQSHAASAFFASPFKDALVLTMDGVGEWATTSISVGRENKLKTMREIHFPHSIGLLYSAFTYYLGFKVNSGEYKMMGLAPYGKPIFADLILSKLIDVKKDGSFHLDMSYFDYCAGLSMVNQKFIQLFGETPRNPDDTITQRHMDLAASIQWVTEEVILRITRSLALEGISRNLCLAGGVALNCVANGRILRDGKFDHVWVQPAAGDAGGAVGAALAAYHSHLGYPRTTSSGTDGMSGTYLGPEYTSTEIESQLADLGANFKTYPESEMLAITVEALNAGKAVGWFQGRMEFGPRALGGRSILGDARNPSMQKTLNLKVKYRESFRPFAPAVLLEDMSNWFEMERESPYMLFTANITQEKRLQNDAHLENLFGIDKLNVPRSEVPAITHVDYSARVQTVNKVTNPVFHSLIEKFKEKTGCPMLVNTSFNIRGEPIVCSPTDAFRCFMGTDIELLVVGNTILHKEMQDTRLRANYQNLFAAD